MSVGRCYGGSIGHCTLGAAAAGASGIAPAASAAGAASSATIAVSAAAIGLVSATRGSLAAGVVSSIALAGSKAEQDRRAGDIRALKELREDRKGEQEELFSNGPSCASGSRVLHC